eukprot:7096419-Prymnesium_polylepis.1
MRANQWPMVAYLWPMYGAPGDGIGRYARPAVPLLARGTCRCEDCSVGEDAHSALFSTISLA